MTTEEALLGLALLSPLLGVLGAAFLPQPVGQRCVQVSALAAAVAWGGLLVSSSVVRVGAFHTGPLVASVGCGAALLLACVDRDRTEAWAPVGGGIALTAISAGFSAGGGGGHALAILAALSLAALTSMAASWEPKRVAGVLAPPAAAIGIGATAVGVVLAHAESGEWLLPAPGAAFLPEATVIALLVGSAGLCLAGGLRAGRSTTLLLAGGLALGLRAAPLVDTSGGLGGLVGGGFGPAASDGLGAAVVGLTALALGAAALRRAPLAFALVALAVASGPPAMLPASRLLAAAAVLALAIDRLPAWLLAAPGAAAIAVGVIEAGTGLATVSAVGAALVAAVLAGVILVDGAGGDARQPHPLVLAPILVGAWLFLAPGSWTWVGSDNLDFYDVGLARGAAAGLIAAVVAVAWRQRTKPSRILPPSPNSEDDRAPGAEHEREGLDLVRSERSAS